MNYIILLLVSFIIAEPQFTVITNNNPSSGKIFIHSVSNFMTILDQELEPYWMINSDNKGMDFKYNNGKLSYFHHPTQSNNNPFWIIANSSMQEIDTVRCTDGFTDFHDIIITDENTYILQSYDQEIMDLSSVGGQEFTAVKSILRLQEFDLNHNLIFDWKASDYLNIFDYEYIITSGTAPLGQVNWMHGNSIDIDYDNNLILSNRKSSEIIKIDRITGEIIWIIGGPTNEFEILNDPLNGVNSQHDVKRLANGNLLVFDNGKLGEYPASRVVEYELDEENLTANMIWQYENPYGYLSRAMGSAQRLPNQNTFINWGSIIENGESIGAIVMEVDYDKNVVLEIRYQDYQAYKATKSIFQFSIPMQIGDINLDNTLNIQDIIFTVNYVLDNNENHSIFHLYKVDSNLDHLINIIDIIDIVNRVLD